MILRLIRHICNLLIQNQKKNNHYSVFHCFHFVILCDYLIYNGVTTKQKWNLHNVFHNLLRCQVVTPLSYILL